VPASAGPIPPPADPLAAAPLGAMGSSFPGLGGGGVSGLGQQLADTLSGLLGGAGGGIPDAELPDAPELEVPADEEADLAEDEPAEGEPAEGEPAEGEPAEGEPAEDDAVPVEEAAATAGDSATGELSCEPVAAPAPTPPPPPAEPLPPPAEPVTAEQTPCEVAADEVPQVGEPPG
jgi:hypothetical protein